MLSQRSQSSPAQGIVKFEHLNAYPGNDELSSSFQEDLVIGVAYPPAEKRWSTVHVPLEIDDDDLFRLLVSELWCLCHEVDVYTACQTLVRYVTSTSYEGGDAPTGRVALRRLHLRREGADSIPQ